MPQFDPELVQLMRTVLEDAMTRVPLGNVRHNDKAYWPRPFLEPRPKVTRATVN